MISATRTLGRISNQARAASCIENRTETCRTQNRISNQPTVASRTGSSTALLLSSAGARIYSTRRGNRSLVLTKHGRGWLGCSDRRPGDRTRGRKTRDWRSPRSHTTELRSVATFLYRSYPGHGTLLGPEHEIIRNPEVSSTQQPYRQFPFRKNAGRVRRKGKVSALQSLNRI